MSAGADRLTGSVSASTTVALSLRSTVASRVAWVFAATLRVMNQAPAWGFVRVQRFWLHVERAEADQEP
ncbi:hypothetical protein DAT35_27315 [Vitiosangium sp. GDMCC 1.1324]|nr:hypothetical protein DAT35_27315 [Vitiosangium sp. GDMCC 1.1324]